MEELYSKIQQLNELLKAIKQPKSVLPQPPPLPQIGSQSTVAVKPAKLPGIAPGSTKDPVKVAQQLKAAKMQKLMKPMIKFESNGQWELDPGD